MIAALTRSYRSGWTARNQEAAKKENRGGVAPDAIKSSHLLACFVLKKVANHTRTHMN